MNDAELSEAYRLMAADEAREAEAHEWVEGTCLDVADEASLPASFNISLRRVPVDGASSSSDEPDLPEPRD